MAVDVRRILFPTDFSDSAHSAQQYAKLLAEQFGAELHLLHVVSELTMPLADSLWSMTDAEQQLRIKHAIRRLPEEVGVQWSKEYRTVCAVKVGHTVEEIMNYSNEHEIDLIVIGTHGMTGLSRLLLGSVAEKLVRLATCPVLTVHPDEHRSVPNGEDKRRASQQRTIPSRM